MNDSQLDARIRAALPARVVPATLAQKIDGSVQRHRRIHRIVRPLRFAVVLGATGVLAAVMGPPVYAQATMGRIAGALDGVSSLRLTRTAIDAQGRRYPAGEMLYRDGKWRLRAQRGDMLYENREAYVWDPVVSAYVAVPKPNGPFGKGSGVRMSELLGVASKWSMDRRVSVDEAALDGKTMRRATVENAGLDERYVIFADPKSDLPEEVRVEARESGRWRLRMVQRFEYGASIPATELSLPPSATVMTQEERTKRVVAKMTSAKLGEMPLPKGRIVVRAIDVARDGTVFVAYQAGDRSANSWRGYGLELKDDSGTVYGRQVVTSLDRDFVKGSADGKLEVEVFVPLEPTDFRRRRTFSFTASRMGNGQLARWLETIVTDPNGKTRMQWQPNWRGSDRTPPTKWPLVNTEFSGPTCEAMPSYATLVSPTSFGNEVSTAIFAASVRGKAYAVRRDWGRAKYWYEEALLQMRKHERMGLGPWAEDGVMDQIRAIERGSWRPL